MNKEKLKNMADNPDNIPGIYNYCDRWCERCKFTSRCLNFQWEREISEGKEISDIENEEFWKKMEDIFVFTHELLDEMAKEQGIDLSSIKVTDEEIEEEKQRKEMAKQNQCAGGAKAYSQMAEKWFKSSEEIIKEKENELNRQLSLNLPLSEPEKEAVTLKNAMEVIYYYLHFIHVKIMRACHGKYDDLSESYDFPKDSDGSAKIALISIDRSISAWGKLLKHFSESEDGILEILVHLERLRNITEKEFPQARNFVRPGFDE